MNLIPQADLPPSLGRFFAGSEAKGRTIAVGEYFPAPYESYARVLNPAFTNDGASVRWQDAAEFDVDASTRWSDVIFQGTRDQHMLIDPERGALEITTATALAKLLSRHTETPDDCWFLTWDGYNLSSQERGAATVVVPLERTMHVLRGSLNADPAAVSSRAEPLWWIPNDRKWCVGNDIYARSVFVGGSFAAIGEVLSDPLLEAYTVSPRQLLDTED
ncbi:hypothetical protein [Arthrobacter sp. 31Y]|uniref:hypothetical protein n=1 Tax=Arthrobacter sp. 31Y TaxID=1115632 RepID=UPI000464BF15|nr:hypothetical protein [Arthrobacter sp. 31Y]